MRVNTMFKDNQNFPLGRLHLAYFISSMDRSIRIPQHCLSRNLINHIFPGGEGFLSSPYSLLPYIKEKKPKDSDASQLLAKEKARRKFSSGVTEEKSTPAAHRPHSNYLQSRCSRRRNLGKTLYLKLIEYCKSIILQ